MNEFFGNGCWKSFFHVVRFGFEYAPVNLFDAKNDAERKERVVNNPGRRR